MSLCEVSIRRPVFAWMLMIGLIVFGTISFMRLGISQMPDVDFPVLNVTTIWEGAAPEVMESEIVDRLEQAVISVDGLKEIVSSIRQGQASLTLEFDLSRDIDAALQEVQSSISRIRLPKGVDPPTITKNNPDDQPIVWVGVSSETRSLREIVVLVDPFLRDQFQILPGVGEVFLGGFMERNLRLWIDNEKLKKYELTVLDLQAALKEGHLEQAAGVIENSTNELNLRMMGEGLSTTEVGDLLISKRGGKPIHGSSIRVRDVAQIEDGLSDIRRMSRVDGVLGVGIGVKKQRGANAVKVGQAVIDKVAELQKTLPADVKIGINFDATKFISESISETQFTLLLSALATALVCWLFLGSFRATFNVLLSIPTSIVGTFTVIYFMGFTLNFFTILGLALAIGIVVDDAIMVLENIYRHRDLGKNKVQAALDGSNEVMFAALVATVSVIAIFLPIAFMKGIIGKFFFQFGITISAAVALSLLEAITLTPMRMSQFMEPKVSTGIVGFLDRIFASFSAFYGFILSKLLNWRILTLLVSLLLFVGSLGIAKILRREFLPPQDQSMFMIRFQTPVGSSLEFTNQKLLEAESFIKTRSEIKRYFAAIGGFGGGEVNTGIMFISLHPKPMRELGQYELMDLLRTELSKIKDLKVFAQDLSMRGFTAQRSFPIEFNVRGPSWDVLREKISEISERLQKTELVTDLDNDYRLGMPEVRVWPLREEASRRGVSIEAISATVSAAMGGLREGKFSQDGRRYDLRMRLKPEERIRAEDLEALYVRNSYGELVSLKDVTKLETLKTLQTVTRRNRERSVSFFANVASGKSQADALAEIEKIGKEVLPEGYRLFIAGGAQTFKESLSSLIFVLWLGLLVSYMILASQFNSFLDPIIILLALPFCVTGAFAGLYFTDQSLNLYSMIGIVLLMGIVKKNSILLVEFTNVLRERGLSVNEALLQACPIRLRPILMTTFSTIAAAIPPALALGPGAESRVPMAVTIVGGVLISTFFTLLVVPCAYSLVGFLSHRRKS